MKTKILKGRKTVRNRKLKTRKVSCKKNGKEKKLEVEERRWKWIKNRKWKEWTGGARRLGQLRKLEIQ